MKIKLPEFRKKSKRELLESLEQLVVELSRKVDELNERGAKAPQSNLDRGEGIHGENEVWE